MKKIIILFSIVLVGFTTKLRADEGMWLPMFIERLNYVDMQKMGLHLTAEEIYQIWGASTQYDLFDILASAVGCLLAILTFELIINWRKRRPSNILI